MSIVATHHVIDLADLKTGEMEGAQVLRGVPNASEICRALAE